MLSPRPLLDGIVIVIVFVIIVIVISIIISTLMMTNRYKGGSEVLESERVKVHHRGGRHALSIKKVNIDDNGVHNDDVNIDDSASYDDDDDDDDDM